MSPMRRTGSQFYLLTILFFFFIPSFLSAQIPFGYYKDTTQRIYSDLSGSQVEGQNIYWWGVGTGKYDPAMPVIYKLDASGDPVWSTVNDSLLGFGGKVTNAFVMSDVIYCMGESAKGVTFLAKVDKREGTVLYRRDAVPVNGNQVINWEFKGTDSIRLFYSHWESRYVVYSMNFSTTTGMFSSTPERLSTGLDVPGEDVPVYFDTAVAFYNAHESDYSWTVKKKDRTTNSRLWQTTIYKPFTNLHQADAYNYFFAENLVSCIVDSSGTLLWTKGLTTKDNTTFNYVNSAILEDTLYIVWKAAYTPVSQTCMLSKLDRRTGKIYWNGGVTDSLGVRVGDGLFEDPIMVVDSSGDIYILGRTDASDQQHFRKIAGVDGRQIYDIKMPVDSFSEVQYKVFNKFRIAEYKNLFWMNGRLNFLAGNGATDKQRSTWHVNLARLEDPVKGSISRRNYDNNLYQFPSTTLDLQEYRDNFYIVKREGAEVYLEKYKKTQQLIWKKRLTGPGKYFTPNSFAVDSLENLCIIGHSGDYPEPVHNLSSNNMSNMVLLLDSSASVLRRYESNLGDNGADRQLIGDIEGGFYYFISMSEGYYRINSYDGLIFYRYGSPSDIDPKRIVLTGEETLNKVQKIVTTQDSLFVYSEPTKYLTGAFVIGISRRNGRSTNKIVLQTSASNNAVLQSKLSPSVVYVCGKKYVGYDEQLSIARLSGPMGPAQWMVSYPALSGAITKCVEKVDGNIITLISRNDSVIVMQLNWKTGSTMWMTKYAVSGQVKAYDMALNDDNNMVIVALLKHSVDWKDQQPSYLQVNAATGAVIKEVKIKGNAGTINNILLIKNIPGVGIIMGGNLTSDSLGGLNGFTLLNTEVVSGVVPVCNMKAAFTARQDSSQSLRMSFSGNIEAANSPRYNWNFGDGTPADTNRAPVHTYSAAGTYNVCLDVTDLNNCTASYCDSIRASALPVRCNVQPSFNTEKSDSSSGAVTFVSRVVSGQPLVSYSWNFGDGNISSEGNPTHIFTSSGTYNVCLTVKDSSGCIATYCDRIIIVKPVVPDSCNIKVAFSYYVSNIVSEEVHFNNLSGSDAISYKWNFGDGSAEDTIVNPVHRFSSSERYNVCLTVTGREGCEQTYCDSVVVLPAATPARITAMPNPVTNALFLDFNSETITDAAISIINIYGERRYYQVLKTVVGKNHIGIPVEALQSGIYYVVVRGNGISNKVKFVKL